jgi:hypothetical protein
MRSLPVVAAAILALCAVPALGADPPAFAYLPAPGCAAILPRIH